MVITAATSIHAPDVTVLYFKGKKDFPQLNQSETLNCLLRVGFGIFFLGIESVNQKPRMHILGQILKMAIQKTILIYGS